MENVYLDNAATTRVRENVIVKMQEALGIYGIHHQPIVLEDQQRLRLKVRERPSRNI